MAGKTAILAVRILGDAKGAQQAMGTANAATGGLLSSLGKLGGLAASGLGAVIDAGVAAGKALYDIGEVFDGVEDTIRVGTGAAGNALDDLVASAKTVGAAIPAEFDAISTTLADWNTRLGETGPVLETLTGQALEAGRVLGNEIDIQTVSGSFRAFSLEGEATTAAMDHLFRVSQATGIGMNELASSTEKGAPALKQLGFGFESTSLLIGQLDKAGLDSTKMIAGMTSGLSKLARSGEEPEKAFQRIIGEIGNFATAGKDAAALQLASEIFGTKNAASFVDAIKTGTLSLDDMTSAAGLTSDTILGLGQETADAAEKWQLIKNKAMLALEPLAGYVFDAVGGALDWLLNAFNSIDLSGAVTAISAVAQSIADWLPNFDHAASLVGEWAPTVSSLINTGLNSARDTIDGFVTTALALWNYFGNDIINIAAAAWNFIAGLIGPALEIIRGIIKTVTSVISGDWSGAWNGIKAIASGAWNGIKSIVTGGASLIKNIISGAVDLIATIWSGAWNGIKAIASGAWNGITNAASSGVNSVISFFRDLPSRIMSALSGIGSQMASIGRNMITSLANALNPATVVRKMKSVIGDAISWAKNLLGIASPSKVFAGIGRNISDGLALGIVGQQRAVRAATDTMIAASIPRVALPRLASGSPSPAASSAAPEIQITVNGALDASAVARQILHLLQQHLRVTGAAPINATLREQLGGAL